jgi:hypothetical protein
MSVQTNLKSKIKYEIIFLSYDPRLPKEHWWNGTDRGEWGIGVMVLNGKSGALVEWY